MPFAAQPILGETLAVQMTVRVQLLGTVAVSGSHIDAPRLSNAVRQVVALIAATGRDGITRDELSQELWGSTLPNSWKSAIRNRMTAARKALGSDALLNEGGRFSFADFVTVDTWDLIGHATDRRDDLDDLAFLEGEPLVDIEDSPIARQHVRQVADARAVMIQQLVATTAAPLSPATLQGLRTYQRHQALHPLITTEVVRAHLAANEQSLATAIVDEVRKRADTTGRQLPWIDQLDRIDHHEATGEELVEAAEVRTRAELFRTAAGDEDWSVALEIAMSGLPQAELSSGDPERLKLLEAIPLDKLDDARQFTYCLAMTRHLMYSGREEQASEWYRTTQSLAETPDQELLTYITAVIVGAAPDERAPIPLPEAFDQGADQSVSMQSLQVAVMSYLERASAEEAAPLVRRFHALVEASADPYRRWHALLMQSMAQFVDGEFDAAREAAYRAFKYADLFDIADAEIALVGQLANAQWICGSFDGPTDLARDYAASADSALSRALQAIQSAERDGGQAVHEFLASFDFTSRSFFALPSVLMVAGHIVDPDLRRRVAQRLAQRTDTCGIWGSGVLHMGPVDRTLAMLVDDPMAQERHLIAAVECADRQNFRVWQVVSRLDLAAFTRHDEHRQRAEELATTPALQQIVRDYPGVT